MSWSLVVGFERLSDSSLFIVVYTSSLFFKADVSLCLMMLIYNIFLVLTMFLTFF